jgi:hypothetical protein
MSSFSHLLSPLEFTFSSRELLDDGDGNKKVGGERRRGSSPFFHAEEDPGSGLD